MLLRLPARECGLLEWIWKLGSGRVWPTWVHLTCEGKTKEKEKLVKGVVPS